MAKKQDKKEEKKVGKPTDYSPELAEQICLKVSTCTLGLKRLSEMYDWFPHRDTVYTWLLKHPEFADMYAQARRNQAQIFADEIIEISDNSALDSTVNDDGHVVCDHEYIQRSRLRVDSRKWIACKLIPKVYGDKVTNELTGADGKPIQTENKTSVKIEAIDDRIKDILTK